MSALTLTLSDAAALKRLFEEQLSKRRAFLTGAGGVEAMTACTLVLEQGGRSHTLAAEVVYVKAEEPGCGVGLQLSSLDGAAMEALRAFVESARDDPPAEAAPDAFTEEGEGEPVHLHERIRGLSGPEQQRMAANGTLAERVSLERMYGPSVWETLLKNQRLTVPEVARIARKGILPRPLVEAIAANSAWLAAGEVQRALLSNPRSTSQVVEKIFRALPRRDLARVPQQTAYPMTVRIAAKRILDERG